MEVFDFLVNDKQTSGVWTKSLCREESMAVRTGRLAGCVCRLRRSSRCIAFQLLGLLSQSLALEAEHIHKHFVTDSIRKIRIEYYPPYPIPDLALGSADIKTHQPSLFSYTMRRAGGLQVRWKDGA